MNGDSSNVPEPEVTSDISGTSTARVLQNMKGTQGMQTGNPKAPYAVDPLNGGMPEHDADEADSQLLELELGGTGTIIVGGILTEADYNPDLSGRKRIDIYDKMRKSDATVRLGLSAVKHPILAADWYIKPGKTEEEAGGGPMTEFIEQELFKNPNFSYTQFLRQAMTYCDFGHSFFEKVFRMRADGKFGWKKFAPRLPKTIFRYTLEDGITPGITQYLPTGGRVEIPQWKLLAYILELEGSNYEGISLLRSAYMHWYYKDLYYRIDAIASERQGMGVPVIHVPAQATEADKLRAKVIARNMRVNQEAYVDLPPGFTFAYVDTKAKELKEVKEMVMHHDRQILKGFLAHFLDMGASHSGSKNISSDQSELFIVAEQYIARIFQEPTNMAIRELVDLNFTNVKDEDYPSLEHGSIGQIDFNELATSLGALATGGLLVPDPELEKYIRASMGLPDAMDLDDPKMEDDLLRRKVLQPVPPPVLPAKGGGGNNPRKIVNRESALTFAEDLMAMKNELEEIIAQKEHGH